MLTTEKRIELLERLGEYLVSDDEILENIKYRAVNLNPWFTRENIDLAISNIRTAFLDRKLLQDWLAAYPAAYSVRTVGIVMAGNIPLVGFHDFICGFLSGHRILMKLSSKDEVLMKHIVGKITEWEPLAAEQVAVADQLKSCDAYIATGSNNSARYFEAYFGKYPSIIRKNRTSVAILEGDETAEELSKLGDDVFTYFGLGCRNVTQLCVPAGYDFSHLLEALSSRDELMLFHKYKNNYDYHLAIYLLNRVPYLTNGSLLLVENELPFSAVSVLHYRYYEDMQALAHELEASGNIQTIVGRGFTPFGSSQQPGLSEYADGIDTMKFLTSLN